MPYTLPRHLDTDKLPKEGEIYTVIGIKKLRIKNKNNEYLSFKIKEFNNNKYLQWFSSTAFEFDKDKIEKLSEKLEPEII